MQYNQALFKIGGKVLGNQSNLESTMTQLSQLYEQGILLKIIIIPGGGSYANFIRLLEDKLNFGDDLAHWPFIQ